MIACQPHLTTVSKQGYDAGAMPVNSDTVAVGSEAPDFTLEAIDGSQVSLSSYKGKPVVLVFLRGFR